MILGELLKKVTIYTDGSCLGNPGPGGWAAILRLDGTDIFKEISGGAALTTNNRMEITGVLEGLNALKETCQVVVHTDSRYVADAIGKGWIWGWQKKYWQTAAKKAVKNVDLWKKLLPLLNKHDVQFEWLRGHVGNADNERCDVLARQQASRDDLQPDMGYLQSDNQE